MTPTLATKSPARRLLTATVFAAALGLGTVFGPVAIAIADDEWDVGAYDDCMSNAPRSIDNLHNDIANDVFTCCAKSGGAITKGSTLTEPVCGTPPVENSNTSDAGAGPPTTNRPIQPVNRPPASMAPPTTTAGVAPGIQPPASVG